MKLADKLNDQIMAGNTDLPGAPLTSFFDSLSPLQKQLLIQQQFQQTQPGVSDITQFAVSPQQSSESIRQNIRGENTWFPVSTY